jgi:transcriptional regulator with XRE-family HTH domain
VPTLKELREGKFLTQRELAELVGVHPTMVSEWERGLYRPSLRNLRKICELFEVSPGEIEWPPIKGLALTTQGEARHAATV